MESKSKSIQGPPQGTFKTMAVLVADDKGNLSQYSGTMETGNFLTPGDLYISVMARDPYTGQAARINGVKVSQTMGSIITGLPPEGLFELTCPTYEGFRSRDPIGMSVLPIDSSRTVQNMSLPQPIKVKDTVDNFSATSNSPTCRAYDANVQAGQRSLGLIHERDDLHVLQGKQNGNSPGVAVNQGAGSIYVFGTDGKQHMNISPGGGIQMKAANIDQGNAQQELTSLGYGGMPSMINPMTNVIPQGPIVCPQPRTVPNVLKILNMVATIVDMIDLIKCCSDAVKAVKGVGSSDENKKIQQVLNEAAGPSSMEQAFMSPEEQAIASNNNLTQEQKDAALKALRAKEGHS